ncbi:MAG TPA: TSUP family transporter, partial [Pseudomonadales bacterium]|nr:TSUP family transporter [Pseudomonadales bacterium]
KHLHLRTAQGLSLDWQVLGTFVLLGAAGSVAGSHFASRVPQATLRRVFAAFLVLMAAFILYESGPRALGPG